MTRTRPSSSRLSQEWIRIGETLNLRVTAPVSILLSSGEQIDADVLLPDFGAKRGMLLVTKNEVVWAHRAAVINDGYGFSVLSEPTTITDSEESLQTVSKMLRDWGWAGAPEDEPAWMRSG